jgi:hypothetical protein
MIRRREFILALAGTAVVPSFLWPLRARGEPKPKMLRVGYVGVQSPDAPLYGDDWGFNRSWFLDCPAHPA